MTTIRSGWLVALRALGAAAISTALAVAVIAAMEQYVGRTFYAAMILAVILGAWLGGVGSGVAASFFGALAIDYFFQEPRFTLAIAGTGDAIQVGMFLVVGVAVSYLVRTRKEAREKLRRHAQTLELIRERDNVAMDLHDGIIQSLYSSVVTLAGIRRGLPDDQQAAREALEKASQVLVGEIEGVRAYIGALRTGSADSLDLRAGLSGLVERVRAQHSLRAQLDVHEDAEAALGPAEVGDLLYIAAECLSNVSRHAEARELAVSLSRTDGWVALSVRDDGRGFFSDERGWGEGLRNIRERAARHHGRVTVSSLPERGTTITVRMPARSPSEVAKAS